MSARRGLQADLSRLLGRADISGSFTLRTVTEGIYNPVADTFASDSSSGYTASGVMVGYSLADQRNETILERDKRLIIDASSISVEPQPGMIAIAAGGGGNYSLISVKEIAPSGTVIAYDCQVRQ